MIHYEKHRLTRIITVQEIVSADYVKGLHPASYNHLHQEAWEMCVCLEGETVAIKDYQKIRLAAGQIVFIHPGIVHDVSISEKDASSFVVSFTCSNYEYLRPLQDAIITADPPLLDLFYRMIDELESTFVLDFNCLHLFHFIPNHNSPLGAEQMICCYLEQVLLTLLRQATMNQGQIIQSGQFQDAIQIYLVDQVTTYIEEHLGDHLTAGEIAEHFHYSRARLSTIYKNITGFGISEMITHVRITAAKAMLTAQEKSITQISEELGFSSPQYFSHKFAKEVGCPPSKYAVQGK